MAWVRKALKWIAAVPLGVVATILFTKLVDVLFDAMGWSSDPASVFRTVMALFMGVYEHPWFAPVAIASIAFATGVWLDYGARTLFKQDAADRLKRMKELAYQADQIGSDMDRTSRRLLNGRVDAALFAEISSFMVALRDAGIPYPNINPTTTDDIAKLRGYLKALSVYLKRDQIEMARNAHELFNSSEPSEPEPSDRI